MCKKQYSSKKKKRRAEYLERETRREMERKRIERFNKTTDIEEAARLLGVPLK